MKTLQKLWSAIQLTVHFMKGVLQLGYGAWKIGKLPFPAVSIFGGSRLKQESVYVNLAHELAHKLVMHNISVITGGGPGIMEAANYGAANATPSGKLQSIGIGVKNLRGEEGLNPYVREAIVLDYFFARKYLLIYYSTAYVIFPGGYGTVDELAELLTLMQTGKLDLGPVVFVGTAYWKHFFEWIEDAREEGLLHGADIPLVITDDIDAVVKIVVDHCQKCKEN